MEFRTRSILTEYRFFILFIVFLHYFSLFLFFSHFKFISCIWFKRWITMNLAKNYLTREFSVLYQIEYLSLLVLSELHITMISPFILKHCQFSRTCLSNEMHCITLKLFTVKLLSRQWQANQWSYAFGWTICPAHLAKLFHSLHLAFIFQTIFRIWSRLAFIQVGSITYNKESNCNNCHVFTSALCTYIPRNLNLIVLYILLIQIIEWWLLRIELRSYISNCYRHFFWLILVQLRLWLEIEMFEINRVWTLISIKP